MTPLDADMTQVEEILRAASRGPDDPDVQLAMLLFELAKTEGPADPEEVLERLARDAHSD